MFYNITILYLSISNLDLVAFEEFLFGIPRAKRPSIRRYFTPTPLPDLSQPADSRSFLRYLRRESCATSSKWTILAASQRWSLALVIIANSQSSLGSSRQRNFLHSRGRFNCIFAVLPRRWVYRGFYAPSRIPYTLSFNLIIMIPPRCHILRSDAAFYGICNFLRTVFPLPGVAQTLR